MTMITDYHNMNIYVDQWFKAPAKTKDAHIMSFGFGLNRTNSWLLYPTLPKHM